MGALELNSSKIEAAITKWMDVIVLSDGKILFSIKRGPDITGKMEKILEELGLECRQEFKSPCG